MQQNDDVDMSQPRYVIYRHILTEIIAFPIYGKVLSLLTVGDS